MKTIALLLTSIALVSCASDSGHRTSHRPDVFGRTPVPDDEMIDPDWRPTPPPMPRPGPPAMEISPVDRFGPVGRIFVPDAPRLGEPPREPSRRFPTPDVLGSIRPSRTGSILRSPARETIPPATVIPRLPSPRPAETSRFRVPSRTLGTDSALRLDRTAISR